VAYPFSPNICLRDLIAKLEKEFACECKKLTLHGPRGPEVANALVRTDKGTTHIATLPDVAADAGVAPTVLRSICRRLGVDPSEFGFSLMGEDEVDHDDDVEPTAKN
jgi:hypothetical protein